jgi:hypothetical protein
VSQVHLCVVIPPSTVGVRFERVHISQAGVTGDVWSVAGFMPLLHFAQLPIPLPVGVNVISVVQNPTIPPSLYVLVSQNHAASYTNQQEPHQQTQYAPLLACTQFGQ